MNPPEILARTTSGWFAVESDGVIHGWARDRAAPAERLTVAIAIDGERIATARCDRLVPNLRDQEGNDGLSGFACAVPPCWRDGQPHEVTVEVPLPGDEIVALKSRRNSFTLTVVTPPAAVFLDGGDGEGVAGTVIGNAGRELVDLWIDGQRVTDGPAPAWRWDEGTVSPFRLPWTGGAVALAQAGAVLAYPGTIEAGMAGVAVASLFAGTIQLGPDGHYRLRFDQRLHLPDGTALAGELLGGGTPIAVPLRIEDGAALFTLPEMAFTQAPQLRLVDPHGRPFGEALALPTRSVPLRLIPNADLARWSGNTPEGFEGAAGVTRSFHAFPPGLKTEQRLSGEVALVPVAREAGALLFAHPLPPLARWSGAELGVQLFARASTALTLSWVLERGGEAIATHAFTIGPRWQLIRAVLPVPHGNGPLRLALVRAEAGEAAFVDIAGLSAGAPQAEGFADAPATPLAAAPGENLVRNAALLRWPNGLLVDGTGPQVPLAEHWRFVAEEAVAVRAAAVTPPPGAEGYALSLSLPDDGPGGALEIGLNDADISGAGRLSFSARLAPEGSRFGLIERITLIRARAGGGDETVAALIARRLVVGRSWDKHRLRFLCRDAAERHFASEAGYEFRLRFEVGPGLHLQFHDVDLRMGNAIATAEPAAPLAFEDPVIRAQLTELKGLEAWRSPHLLRPAADGRPAPAPPEPRRWRGSAGAVGAIEIGIAVHDAGDETLACLASLPGSTAVPHLVRLLDDASGEDTRQRIARFIADKPWMRLDTQDGHRGYTATANALVGGSAADWVVLLNSDTVVSAGWLEGLLAPALADDRTAMVGPVSNAATYQSVPDPYDGTGKWAVNPLPPGWTAAQMAAFVTQVSEAAHPEVPLLNGFCTLIRRTAFDAVGGFDERRFPAGYGEENDLCLRLRKAGWRLRVADDVYVWHAKSASFGQARRAQLSKAGDAAFRALHGDVDIGALGRQFLATPALSALREAVRAAYPPATRRAEEAA